MSQLPLNQDIALSLSTARLEAVPQHPGQISLLLDGTQSSFIDLFDPEFLAFEYMQYLAEVITFAGRETWRALHLGAAGCSMARWLHATHPGSHQLGIEVDEKLTEYVRQWFDLPRAPSLKLRATDGLAYLLSCPAARWDLIIRDVFFKAEVPAHMADATYTAEILRVLAPEGLYLANCPADKGLLQVRQELQHWLAAGADVTQLALITEPAVLRGKRFGNIILGYSPLGEDLWQAAGLARMLRSAAVPANLVSSEQLRKLLG